MAQPNQLLFPNLEMNIMDQRMGIIGSRVDYKSGNIEGYVCRDDTSWTKTIPADTTEGEDTGQEGEETDKVYTCSDYTIDSYDCDDVGDDGTKASQSCPVACNTCPSDIDMVKDVGRTYDRLPSPIEDSNDPLYAGILQDGNWRMGDISDVSRNPELYDKLDELEEKVDNIRKSMVDVKCLCSDLSEDKSDKKDGSYLRPNRCGNVSEMMEWDGKELWTDDDSKDTDVRYKVKCSNGKSYSDKTINPRLDLENKELVYNCTSQTWESRNTGTPLGRREPFRTFDFKGETVRCEKATEDPDYPVNPVVPTNTCTCLHGTPVTGAECKKDGQIHCASCKYGDVPDPQPGTNCPAPPDPLDELPSLDSDPWKILFVYGIVSITALLLIYNFDDNKRGTLLLIKILGVIALPFFYVMMRYITVSYVKDEDEDAMELRRKIIWGFCIIFSIGIYALLYSQKGASGKFSDFLSRHNSGTNNMETFKSVLKILLIISPGLIFGILSFIK